MVFTDFRKNSNSIITEGLNKVDLNRLSSSLTINLKKAKLLIRNEKGVYLEINKDGDLYFNTQDSDFNVGDKMIWLAGQSSDFEKVKLTT